MGTGNLLGLMNLGSIAHARIVADWEPVGKEHTMQGSI